MGIVLEFERYPVAVTYRDQQPETAIRENAQIIQEIGKIIY